MTRHLVLGAAGFLGRHVVSALAEHGHRVAASDVRPLSDPELSSRTRRHDLCRATPAEWDAVLGDADVVHHCAWTTVPVAANAAPVRDLCENGTITIGLLEALRRRGGGAVVFASSGGTVYGHPRVLPIPEDHPLHPITAYGAAKVAAETYLRVYRSTDGIDARVLRIANLYGAGQDPGRGQGAVTTFLHRGLARAPIEIWGDGTVERDFVHVRDAAAAFVAAAAPDARPAQDLPVHNVGSGRRHALRAVLALVEAALGTALDVRWGPARPFDVASNELAIGKAADELGWRPRIALEAGIAEGAAEMRTGAASGRREPSTLR